MSIVERVRHSYLHRQNTPLRVAARYLQAKTQVEFERKNVQHKVLGKNARFQWGEARGWSRPVFLIEELPQKGKKKLGVWALSLDLHLFQNWAGMSSIYFGANSMARKSKIGSGDDFQTMVRKLEGAIEQEAEDLISNLESGKSSATRSPDEIKKNWKNIAGYFPRKDTEFYLNVMPEGVEPFTVNGKDFTMDVTWTGFKAYSPNSDFHQADPHYQYIEAASPMAARKLFKILNADKEALQSISWFKLSDWLAKNKVPSKTRGSSW